MKSKHLIASYPLEEVTVVGIASVLKGYKLAWLINHTSSMKLTKAIDLSTGGVEEEGGHIIYFSFVTEHASFRLVKNALLTVEGNTMGYLMAPLKHFDFFFIVEDATQAFQPVVFCDALRATGKISYASLIPQKRWMVHQGLLLSVLGGL